MKSGFFAFILMSLAVVVLCASSVNAQTLYAVDRTSNLYTVNPTTGATTLVGATGIDVLSALARDPLTNTIYAATGGASSSRACIYTINITTGAATLVGCDPRTVAAAWSIPGIAIRSDGTLFAIIEGQDDLATIDKSTSATTIIGDMGASPGYGQGLTFTPTDTLLHSDGANNTGGTDDGAFWTTNQTTGIDTQLSVYSFSGFPAFNGEARLTDMAYNQNGVLYGVVFDEYDPATSVYLATANPATGVITYVAALPGGATGIQALVWGAPDQTSQVVPTLNQWGLLIFVLSAGIGSILYLRRKQAV